MNNIYRRDNGLAYICDDTIRKEQLQIKKLLRRFNKVMPFDIDEAYKLIDEMGIKCGNNTYFEPPLYLEYGKHIEIGNNFYANTNFTILDVAKVTIGDNVFIGPNTSLYTAGHPLHFLSRNTGLEYGLPIKIGNNVWIGGSVTILPGVSIGDNAVIGAGSVVSKDIPNNVIAVGNPCKVIREINDNDLDYLYKNVKFDEEALAIINNKK